ncbi:MAG: family 16 glycosylhydrolase [Lentimonas sp.]
MLLISPNRTTEWPRWLVLIIAIYALTQSLIGNTELNIPGYRVSWHDEFEGDSVDPSKWQVNEGTNAWYVRASDGRTVEPQWFGDPFSPWTNAGSINDERQYYTADNVSTNNGFLEIKADRGSPLNPFGYYIPNYHRYTSGKLNTADEFQFQYGIVRIRADLPEGKGLWPALWMLNEPGSPWYWDDEIDIMEGRGSQPTVTTSAHHFKVNGVNVFNNANYDVGVDYQAGFHVYGLNWDSDSIRTSVDGAQVFYDDQAVPQEPMFLIMNAAVGGFFDGLPDSSTVFPTYLKVDWVRVWQPAEFVGDLSNGGFESFEGVQWPDWNTRGDGNLSVETQATLDGVHSVRIDQLLNPISSIPESTNLFTDGTGGAWSGWLNERDVRDDETKGYSINPATIPATLGINTITMGIHQSAPSVRANAVAYRSFNGADLMGLKVACSLSVNVDEAFPSGSGAFAFIRVFDVGFGFAETKVEITEGGDFTLERSIPSYGVPFVQVGIETIGPTGGSGQISASEIRFVDQDEVVIVNETNATGFEQTTLVTGGQVVRYGVLVANHPTDPMAVGSQATIRLEFLNSAGSVLANHESILLTSGDPAQAKPFVDSKTAPVGTVQARMIIERSSTDLSTDNGGSFLVDVAFLQIAGDTGLPEFTSEPSSTMALNEGDSALLDVTCSSTSPLIYRWYHHGQLVGETKDLAVTASPQAAGQYYLVIENDAGVCLGAVTEVSVAIVDSDGDQLTDYIETSVHGTNPNNADSDGDGMSDYEELVYFLTDPLDRQSVLKVNYFELRSANQVRIDFDAVAGVKYQFQISADLDLWQTFGSVYTASQTAESVFLNFPERDPPFCFFRIGNAE